MEARIELRAEHPQILRVNILEPTSPDSVVPVLKAAMKATLGADIPDAEIWKHEGIAIDATNPNNIVALCACDFQWEQKAAQGALEILAAAVRFYLPLEVEKETAE